MPRSGMCQQKKIAPGLLGAKSNKERFGHNACEQLFGQPIDADVQWAAVRSRWGIIAPHQNNFPIRPDNRNIFPIAPRCGEYFPDFCAEDAPRGGAKFRAPKPRFCLIAFSDDMDVFYQFFRWFYGCNVDHAFLCFTHDFL